MTSWADKAVKPCFPSDLRRGAMIWSITKDFPGRSGFKEMLRGGGGAEPTPRDLLAAAFG